jgi:hypothetical protein
VLLQWGEDMLLLVLLLLLLVLLQSVNWAGV